MPRTSANIAVLFRAKEIRDILKSKSYCLRAGFSPNDIIIQTLNDIRNQYVRAVGLPTYLSQMLGNLSTAQIRHCTLYNEDGRRINLYLNGNHNQPLQRFITRQFPVDQLPFKVKVRNGSKADRVDTRYL